MLKKSAIQKSNLPWHNGVSLFSLPESYRQAFHFRLNKLYESYPIHSFPVLHGQAILEGIVYNATNTEVKAVAELLFAGNKIGVDNIRKATATWSGEWCLWVQLGANLFIINDSLGRLPMYWLSNDGHFFVGRHLGLLAQNQLLRPDKMGVASLLWSGYLIDNQTIYKGVTRLPGGSLVQVDLSTGAAEVAKGTPFNFDARSSETLQQQAENLAALFKQACSRIAGSWPGLINISQSGGQDSRAVAVGFRNAIASDRLIASSFVMRGAERDAALGKTIAEALKIPFASYEVAGNTGYEQELLANKMGMNYVAMAFIHDFYKQMLKQNSSFLYVTGDGGDKALPYLGEKSTRISINQLVAQLSRRHATTPVETVAGLVGIGVDDMHQMIYNTIKNYPEQEVNNKSIHFAIYERAGTCMFEGEDRSRYFAWATTPFYDLDFFKAAMLVPDAYKKHYTIYRPFQNALSKAIADIPDASGHSINSWKFVARKRVQELFRSAPPPVKNMVRKLGGVAIRVNGASQQEHTALAQRLINFNAMKDILNPEAAAAFFTVANEEQYQYIRTLILLDQHLNLYL